MIWIKPELVYTMKTLEKVGNISLSQSYFGAIQDMPVDQHTIGELLASVASTHGKEEALVEITQNGKVGRRWTYEILYQNSLRLASALASRFRKGAHVVVWSPNSPEWLLMEYGAALAGLVIVTANPSIQEKELRYILEQSNAVALFLIDEFRGNPMAEIGAAAIQGNTKIQEITNLNDHRNLFQKENNNTDLPVVKPEDPAQIQYTSGTTGFPKGAVLSHKGLVNNAKFYASRCGVTEVSTWINIMPMFHTSGCGMVTLGCLNTRCRMILVSMFDPKIVLSLIETFHADIILTVPTTALVILEEQESNPHDVKSLRVLSCGGANVPPEMIRRIQKSFGCYFSTLYGQTEYCPVITQHHLTDKIEDICYTIGQPLSQTEVSIQAIDTRKILQIEEVGEICVRGPSVMLEYFGNPEATNQTIDGEGWLHTGDLGKMDSRGYVNITGRVKEMIIRGGENHFPAEIENILREHEDISDVAVVGIPDEKWGEVISAFIRFYGNPKSETELKKFCRSKISPQKTPYIWIAVESFPLTGSQKIQKFKLRDNYQIGLYQGMELKCQK